MINYHVFIGGKPTHQLNMIQKWYFGSWFSSSKWWFARSMLVFRWYHVLFGGKAPHLGVGRPVLPTLGLSALKKACNNCSTGLAHAFTGGGKVQGLVWGEDTPQAFPNMKGLVKPYITLQLCAAEERFLGLKWLKLPDLGTEFTLQKKNVIDTGKPENHGLTSAGWKGMFSGGAQPCNGKTCGKAGKIGWSSNRVVFFGRSFLLG